MFSGKEKSAGDSLLMVDIWPKAQKALPRFKAATFFSLVFVPAALTAGFVCVFGHDLLSPRKLHYCWREENGGDGNPGFHWAGTFLHWLSLDWHGNAYHCNFVPPAEAFIFYFLVLTPTWVLILISAWVTRRLRRDRGIIRKLLERVYLAIDADTPTGQQPLSGYLGQVRRNDQTVAHLRALERDGRGAKPIHIWRAFLFQAVMFLFDYFVKGYTLRWILWYQVVWLSFTPTIVQVRPLVKFSFFLSRTLIDFYIELVRERRGSWLQLLEWHRELELDLLQLWGKVNLHTVMPSVPFVSLSLMHFLVDKDETSGTIVASFLLGLAGLVLVTILHPISKISSMYNSSLAFKAEPKLEKGQAEVGRLRRPGSMSIVAVARSLALEHPLRSPAEDQQYATYLEYVQGNESCVALGVPGFFMVPITSSTVAGMFNTFILKLPLFVSLFLAARHRVNSEMLHRSR